MVNTENITKHMKTIAVVGMVTTAIVAIASVVIASKISKKAAQNDEDFDDLLDDIADELTDAFKEEDVETIEDEDAAAETVDEDPASTDSNSQA